MSDHKLSEARAKVDVFRELMALEQLEAAKKIDSGIGEWIAQMLTEGHSAIYTLETLTSAVAEERRIRSAGRSALSSGERA